MSRRKLIAALAVGLAAFTLYRSTLLPGADFGDTGSFQTMVGSPLITPRCAIILRPRGNWRADDDDR